MRAHADITLLSLSFSFLYMPMLTSHYSSQRLRSLVSKRKRLFSYRTPMMTSQINVACEAQPHFDSDAGK